jgi:hypothetical protein
MARRYNDPALRREAVRLADAGMSCWRVAKLLGIGGTTVRWYLLHRDGGAARSWACPHCGTRAADPAGHPGCAVGPGYRGWT